MVISQKRQILQCYLGALAGILKKNPLAKLSNKSNILTLAERKVIKSVH
jgi:hypothetical protein